VRTARSRTALYMGPMQLIRSATSIAPRFFGSTHEGCVVRRPGIDHIAGSNVSQGNVRDYRNLPIIWNSRLAKAAPEDVAEYGTMVFPFQTRISLWKPKASAKQRPRLLSSNSLTV